MVASIGQRSGRQPTVASEPVIRQTRAVFPQTHPDIKSEIYRFSVHNIFSWVFHNVRTPWSLDWRFHYSNVHSESICSQWETAKHIVQYFWNSKAPLCDCNAHFQMSRDLYLNNTMTFHATAPILRSHCDSIIVIEIDGNMKRLCSWHCDAVRRPWSFQCESRNRISFRSCKQWVHWSPLEIHRLVVNCWKS